MPEFDELDRILDSFTGTLGDEKKVEVKNIFVLQPPWPHTNPIRNVIQRNSVRFLIFILVTITRAVLSTGLTIARALSPYSGIPTISLLLATQPWLSKCFMMFLWFYATSMLLVNLTMTSANHTNTTSPLLGCINAVTVPFYLVYFGLLMLIFLVPVIVEPAPHFPIAAIGVLVGYTLQFLLWCRRFINREHNRSYTIFLTLNLLQVLLGVGYSFAFGIVMKTVYEAETYTSIALLEYLLYDGLIALDYFRILDVWFHKSN
jgi:hypothetical protein